MAPPIVIANSLSDITQIASNPPKYPRNPTEQQRQPLTLYIARVPGSQDVILTTLKPQLKNVTVEDVASSLYYLHVNTEDDARLLAEEAEIALSERLADPQGEAQMSLPRKPLPEKARISLDLESSKEPTTTGQRFEASADQLRRKPIPESSQPSLDLSRSDHSHLLEPPREAIPMPIVNRVLPRKEVAAKESPSEVPDQTKEAFRRRPLGPRKLELEATAGGILHSGIENQPPHANSQVNGFTAAESSSGSARLNVPSFENSGRTGSSTTLSVTIIRRDPSSGAQWNVGILLGDSQSPGMKATSYTKKPYPDLSVHLSNPGYTGFRNAPVNSFDEKSSPVDIQQASTNSPNMAVPGFDRQVRMEGSSIWDRASQQHKHSRSDSTGKLSNPRESFTSDDSADTRDSGSKGYVFLSPWGGRCKFSTGGGGRSLRCKHTLPDSLSSSNAVFESSGSAIVSEIRFNLPHSAVFNAPAALKNLKSGGIESGHFSIPKFGHIRDKLSQSSRPPLPPRPHPTSYAAMYPSDDEEPPPLPPRLHAEQRMAESSDEQEHQQIPVSSHYKHTPRSPNEESGERLDLSIGREKAGGGNRGKRAKLGKLIIHNEGFKMLDLVVAANMGVWWSVY